MSTTPLDAGTFDDDTALVPAGDGVFRASISERWSIGRGPHGGYLAALILRGLTMALDDPSRAPLTLTVHFVSQASFGGAEFQAAVERSGRSLTSLSGRLTQGDKTLAVAVASFATPMDGVEYDELPMPEVEGPWPDRRSVVSELAPPFVRNVVLQSRFEPPFQGGRVPMVAGGWTGLPGRRPLDAPALALFSDSWFSPPYIRLTRFVPSPTVALSVYFRERFPRSAAAESEDLCLGRFETRLVRDGCFQSDGVIWAEDGTVIAQSHQLQLLLEG